MICTVSTIKDSLANVSRFVERNLAAGADHLFIFIEGGDREVLKFLEEHPHVTVVDVDEVHRHVPPPSNLNARQTINANRINYLLADVDRVQWLFHIDGDECLDLDKERLLALGPEVECVRLLPKETVGASAREDTGLFKRLLTDEELALLTVLGLIDAPHNADYFHGHVLGKIGIRPSWRRGLLVHNLALPGEEKPQYYRADWLQMLHYESVTPEEFVRKWIAHIEGGAPPFRKDRQLIRGAVSGILNNEHLDEEQKRQYLLEVYRRQLEDDVPVLLKFGLLEKIELRGYSPEGFTPGELGTIGHGLPNLLEADVRYFQPRKVEYDPTVLIGAERSTYEARSSENRITT